MMDSLLKGNPWVSFSSDNVLLGPTKKLLSENLGSSLSFTKSSMKTQSRNQSQMVRNKKTTFAPYKVSKYLECSELPQIGKSGEKLTHRTTNRIRRKIIQKRVWAQPKGPIDLLSQTYSRAVKDFRLKSPPARNLAPLLKDRQKHWLNLRKFSPKWGRRLISPRQQYKAMQPVKAFSLSSNIAATRSLLNKFLNPRRRAMLMLYFKQT